jgi:hypothetical protein
MTDKNLKEIEEEHTNVDSPLPVDDPDLHTTASQRSPDNVRMETAVTPERIPILAQKQSTRCHTFLSMILISLHLPHH